MDSKKILQEIKDNLTAVIKKDSPLGQSLWQALIELHPADLADFYSDIDQESFQRLFVTMPTELQVETFQELPETEKVQALSFMEEDNKVDALNMLPVDELSDFFDFLSDEDLKKSLNLLHKTAREKVLSLLKFDSESAGGIMDSDILSLMQDFTVGQCIKILQRVRPNSKKWL